MNRKIMHFHYNIYVLVDSSEPMYDNFLISMAVWILDRDYPKPAEVWS